MIHEHLQTFSIGRYDLLTSDNLPYSGAMIYNHLTTFPIGTL